MYLTSGQVDDLNIAAAILDSTVRECAIGGDGIQDLVLVVNGFTLTRSGTGWTVAPAEVTTYSNGDRQLTVTL